MAPQKKKSGEKIKRPSAEKRILVAKKKQLINQSFKSKARTMFKKFETALDSKDKNDIEEALNVVYAMADKGVKRGIYKLNKASRIKSRAKAKAVNVA